MPRSSEEKAFLDSPEARGFLNRSKFADKARTPEYRARYRRYVESIPLVHLHEHIGGGVDPEWAWPIINEMYGKVEFTPRGETSPIVFATPEDLRRYVHRPVRTLAEYLDQYDASRAIFNDINNTDAIIDHIVGKHANGGVRWQELRTALKSIDVKPSKIEYTPEQEIEALSDAIRKAEVTHARTGIQVRLILCIRRGKTEEHKRVARRTVELAAAAQSDGLVVGVDLVGKEVGNPPNFFKEEFLLARDLGLRTTIHAGEATADSYVRQALLDCHGVRIGHGMGIKRGSEAYLFAIRNGIGFEVCPTSNLNTGALRTDPKSGLEIPMRRMEDHPAIYYGRDGIVWTVNTDNSGVSDTSVVKEFCWLNERFGLHRGHAKELTRNAIRVSFATDEEKDQLMLELMAADDEFTTKETAASVPLDYQETEEIDPAKV